MSDQPATTTPGTTAPTATNAEHMIPLSRFNEVNDAKRKVEERLATIEAEQKVETEKRLAEQNKYKELAEARGADLVKAQAEAAKVSTYEKTLTDVLASQVEALPEEKRALVPDELTTAQKLAWLAKNAAILKAPAPFDIGAGRTGGGEDRTKPKQPALSSEEAAVARAFGMTEKEYLANK